MGMLEYWRQGPVFEEGVDESDHEAGGCEMEMGQVQARGLAQGVGRPMRWKYRRGADGQGRLQRQHTAD